MSKNEYNYNYCLYYDYCDGELNYNFFKDEEGNYYLKENTKYHDPDVDNELLYNFWKSYLDNNNALPNKKGIGIKSTEIEKTRKQLVLIVQLTNNKKIEMTTDYIGPRKSDYERYGKIELGNFLKETRIIAGSMIWPCRCFYEGNVRISTINQYKGFNKRERMDLVLQDIKKCYNGEMARDDTIGRIFEHYSFWFKDCFENYGEFVKYFKLNFFEEITEKNLKCYIEEIGSIIRERKKVLTVN